MHVCLLHHAILIQRGEMAAFDDTKAGALPEGEEEESPLFCTFAVTSAQETYQAIYICKTCAGAKTGECCCEGCSRTCHKGHKLQFVCFGAAYCDCGKCGPEKCKIIAASRREAEKIFPVVTSAKVGGLVAPSSHALKSILPPSYPICGVHRVVYPPGSGAGHEALRDQCVELVKHSKETFWLAHGAMPRCLLEQLAADLYAFHCKDLGLAGTAGCEWWVQVKDASRDPTGERGASIDLHYDKDEKIAELFQLGVFPLVSTVTYLTQGGAAAQIPTVIFNTTAKAPIGKSPIRDVVVSYPEVGKHISFRGDLLHGAPVEWLLGNGNSYGGAGGGGQQEPPGGGKVASCESERRVTFLLNVWSEHRPADVSPLPESILGYMALVAPGDVPDVTAGECGLSPQPERLGAMSVSLADARGETALAGDFVTIPFISDKSEWGKDDDEQGLVCVAWVPEVSQSAGDLSTLHIRYLHDDCAAALMYEDDEEEWEDEVEGEDEEEGE